MDPRYLVLWPAPMAEEIRTQDRHLEALLHLLGSPLEQATLQEHIQWMRKSFDDASSFGRVLIIKCIEMDTIIGVALLAPVYTLTSGRCGSVENIAVSQKLPDEDRWKIADLLIRAILDEARRIDMRSIFVSIPSGYEFLACIDYGFESNAQDGRMILNIQPAPSGQEP